MRYEFVSYSQRWTDCCCSAGVVYETYEIRICKNVKEQLLEKIISYECKNTKRMINIQMFCGKFVLFAFLTYLCIEIIDHGFFMNAVLWLNLNRKLKTKKNNEEICQWMFDSYNCDCPPGIRLFDMDIYNDVVKQSQNYLALWDNISIFATWKITSWKKDELRQLSR